jgi:quinol-cytochrome oxidoreductase complex cytochrome b subunit
MAMAMARVLRWVVVAMGAAFAVLLVTGLYLTWNYRPVGSAGWTDVHRIASAAFLLLGLATVVLAGMLAVQRHRWGTGIAGGGVFAAGLAAWFTGRFLPFDQLALWAVTVGTNYSKGYVDIFSGDLVRDVRVNGHVMSVDTFSRWFYAHTVLMPIVLLALGIALLRTTRSRSDPETPRD